MDYSQISLWRYGCELNEIEILLATPHTERDKRWARELNNSIRDLHLRLSRRDINGERREDGEVALSMMRRVDSALREITEQYIKVMEGRLKNVERMARGEEPEYLPPLTEKAIDKMAEEGIITKPALLKKMIKLAN